MKKLPTSFLAALSAVALSNCTSPAGPNTQRGAVVGGLIGAGTGAIIGKQSGRTLEGAALGGAAGAGAGALYGNAQDKNSANRGY